MKELNIPLAVFTWLTQASVGLIFMRAIYIRMSGNATDETEKKGRHILLVTMIMMVTGLLCSFAHLNYPAHAYNAMNNLESSWMSREILAETIFMGSTLLWYLLIRYGKKGPAVTITEMLSLFAGIVLIFFMIKTYTLPSLHELNHPSLPVSFIITCFLGGSSVMYFFLRNNEPGLALRMKTLSTIMFIFSLVNHVIFRAANNDILNFNIYTLAYIAALLISVPSVYATVKNKNTISDVIFLNLAILCDLFSRIYELNFTNPGL